MSADLTKKKKGGGFLSRKAQSAKTKSTADIQPDDVLMFTAPADGMTLLFDTHQPAYIC